MGVWLTICHHFVCSLRTSGKPEVRGDWGMAVVSSASIPADNTICAHSLIECKYVTYLTQGRVYTYPNDCANHGRIF